MIRYFDKQLAEIDRAIHSLDDMQFMNLVQEAIETLASGHKIVVSGLGKNVPICEKFVGSMVSLGLDAYFLHTNSAIHGDMGLVKKGDMVIVLSKSGETEESIYLVHKLGDRDARLWLLTFARESTLASMIGHRIVLDLGHEGDMWNIMPNNSTTINLIILQGLAMEIAKRMNLTVEDFKRNHPGGHIGALLKDRQTIVS